jgi:Transposase domain (DUF772)
MRASRCRAPAAPHNDLVGKSTQKLLLLPRQIRSERALCREVQVNLACRWFCGLGLEDKIPDHSVFSRARNERFRDHDIFRQVFERVACIKAGLVGGEGFAVDANLIEFDANKGRSIPGRRLRPDRCWPALGSPLRNFPAIAAADRRVRRT